MTQDNTREAMKSALCVLCAAEKANDWHPNMAKDFAFAIEALRAAISSQPPAAAGALAMRVMQSDLYGQLDDAERAQCDAQIRQHLEWFRGSASATSTEGAQP
jgi:hypothetical protein